MFARRPLNSLLLFMTRAAPCTKRASVQTAASMSTPRCEPPIKPKMWTGRSPLDEGAYTIDCTQHDMHNGPAAHPDLVRRMDTLFNELGVVLLRNTRLAPDLAKMGAWAKALMGTTTKYEGGANSRIELAPNVCDIGSPAEAWIQYHHEMTSMADSVSMLGFCAQSALPPTPEDPVRGATFLSVNTGATDEILATRLGEKLKKKGICVIRCLTDAENATSAGGIFNHWQTSFGVQTVEEVENLAKRKGLKVSWGPGRYLKTKFYSPAFEYSPYEDRNVLYSSIADHSSFFDAWPGLKDLPDIDSFEEATPDQKPLKLTFGDDEEFTRDELVKYAEVYDNYGIPVVWQPGDVSVFCNVRYAHGRHAFEQKETGESRELGIVLGPGFRRRGALADSACANLMVKISDRDSNRADDITKPAHIWNRERYITRQALTGWNPTKLPLPGENGVKIGQFFIYSQLYPTLNSRVLVDVRFLVRYENVHIVSMNPKTKKNVTLRHAVYHKDDIEDDAMNALKHKYIDIRPDGVKVGTHKLVCYIKFYNWLRELYNRPCNTSSTLTPTYGPWGPTYSIERTDW